MFGCGNKYLACIILVTYVDGAQFVFFLCVVHCIGVVSYQNICTVGQLSISFVLTAYRLSDTVKQPVRHFLIHYRSVRGNRILSVSLGFLIDFLYILYWPFK